MTKTRTVLISAIAIGLLAGSTVGVAAQEDAEPAQTVEVNGQVTFAVDVLREYRRTQVRHIGDNFVFCRSDGGPLRASSIRTLFYRLLADAGLPRKRFHDLRHAYAGLQIEAGEDLANISKALGHSNLSTTADIYAHLTSKSQRRMADTMDRVLAAKG